jgi:hypothetical protein
MIEAIEQSALSDHQAQTPRGCRPGAWRAAVEEVCVPGQLRSVAFAKDPPLGAWGDWRERVAPITPVFGLPAGRVGGDQHWCGNALVCGRFARLVVTRPLCQDARHQPAGDSEEHEAGEDRVAEDYDGHVVSLWGWMFFVACRVDERCGRGSCSDSRSVLTFLERRLFLAAPWRGHVGLYGKSMAQVATLARGGFRFSNAN